MQQTRVVEYQGRTVEAVPVGIEEQRTGSSVLTVEGGVRLELRQEVLSVERLLDTFDDQGQPVYVLVTRNLFRVLPKP